MNPISLIYVTAPTKDEALKIGRATLEKKLAACINVWGGMQSMYWWEGKIESASEWVLLIKAPSEKVDQIIALTKAMHSYSTPCVLSWEMAKGNPAYLEWLRGAV